MDLKKTTFLQFLQIIFGLSTLKYASIHAQSSLCNLEQMKTCLDFIMNTQTYNEVIPCLNQSSAIDFCSHFNSFSKCYLPIRNQCLLILPLQLLILFDSQQASYNYLCNLSLQEYLTYAPCYSDKFVIADTSGCNSTIRSQLEIINTETNATAKSLRICQAGNIYIGCINNIVSVICQSDASNWINNFNRLSMRPLMEANTCDGWDAVTQQIPINVEDNRVKIALGICFPLIFILLLIIFISLFEKSNFSKCFMRFSNIFSNKSNNFSDTNNATRKPSYQNNSSNCLENSNSSPPPYNLTSLEDLSPTILDIKRNNNNRSSVTDSNSFDSVKNEPTNIMQLNADTIDDEIKEKCVFKSLINKLSKKSKLIHAVSPMHRSENITNSDYYNIQSPDCATDLNEISDNNDTSFNNIMKNPNLKTTIEISMEDYFVSNSDLDLKKEVKIANYENNNNIDSRQDGTFNKNNNEKSTIQKLFKNELTDFNIDNYSYCNKQNNSTGGSIDENTGNYVVPLSELYRNVFLNKKEIYKSFSSSDDIKFNNYMMTMSTDICEQSQSSSGNDFVSPKSLKNYSESPFGNIFDYSRNISINNSLNDSNNFSNDNLFRKEISSSNLINDEGKIIAPNTYSPQLFFIDTNSQSTEDVFSTPLSCLHNPIVHSSTDSYKSANFNKIYSSKICLNSNIFSKSHNNCDISQDSSIVFDFPTCSSTYPYGMNKEMQNNNTYNSFDEVIERQVNINKDIASEELDYY